MIIMGKSILSVVLQAEIVKLRQDGYGIKEIAKKLTIGIGTSNKYCKGVVVTSSGKERLKSRRFYSQTISKEQHGEAFVLVRKKIGNLTKRDLFLLTIALYWGEGTKRELNLINGDPRMIKVFLDGLLSLGIGMDSIKINIRYYTHQDKTRLTKFWLNHLGLSLVNLVGYEKIDSAGSDKLKYGMCRIRVSKASYFHKVLLHGIDYIASGSSMDRTEAS